MELVRRILRWFECEDLFELRSGFIVGLNGIFV